jgi:hypothetical protein
MLSEKICVILGKHINLNYYTTILNNIFFHLNEKMDNSSIHRNINITITFFFLEKSQLEKLIKYAFL